MDKYLNMKTWLIVEKKNTCHFWF